jgi:hypothetical protein
VVGEALLALGCAALEVVNAGIFVLLAFVLGSDRQLNGHTVELVIEKCCGYCMKVMLQIFRKPFVDAQPVMHATRCRR